MPAAVQRGALHHCWLEQGGFTASYIWLALQDLRTIVQCGSRAARGG